MYKKEFEIKNYWKSNNCKLLPKLPSGQNSQKLSVSLGSLASSGTSNTKFILKSILFGVRKVSLEGTSKMARARTEISFYLRNLICSGRNMEYVVQALNVLRNSVHAETNARCPKTGFYAASVIQTRFLCVIKDLWE